MIFFVIILIAIICIGIEVAPKDSFFNDYCSRRQTATINGIFSLFIFLSHASQYIHLGGVLDNPYIALRRYMGQLVVATFLFYSGYGIMESITKKGTPYVKQIPKHRLFKVWYHYAIVVALFLLVDLIFQRPYKATAIIFSLTAYTSVGNSNWYIFITFTMYLIIFASFMMFKKSKGLALGSVAVLTLVVALIEYKANSGARFYDTVFCFVAGMVFSVAKPKLQSFVMKSDMVWVISFTVLLGAFMGIGTIRHISDVYYNIFAILMVLLIVMITMKVRVGNNILDFFGSHIFSFFILQRIPMIILSETSVNHTKYTFVVLSFAITICLATAFDKCMAKLDEKVYKKIG